MLTATEAAPPPAQSLEPRAQSLEPRAQSLEPKAPVAHGPVRGAAWPRTPRDSPWRVTETLSMDVVGPPPPGGWCGLGPRAQSPEP